MSYRIRFNRCVDRQFPRIIAVLLQTFLLIKRSLNYIALLKRKITKLLTTMSKFELRNEKNDTTRTLIFEFRSRRATKKFEKRIS